jgi:DNA polymerase III delta prime subunit|tara:strand:+ start:249 stop:1187 length:939 start_codon:yes stop_codon:yes gene_type:complete
MERLDNTLWVEKYRPNQLDSYIGNEHLKSKVKVYLESGDLPHLLLYGRAGTGKTTLAKLLVNNIECDHLYINASDENSVDVVRNKVRGFASTIGFKDMKVVILDECDYITPNAQAALRNLMETFSKHTRFILTCNYVERIIDPIQSRCQPFQIVPPSRKEVAVHLNEILKEEEIKFEVDDVATLVNGGYPDIRRVINFAQRQVVDGKLSIDQDNLVAVDLNVNVFATQVVNVLKTQDKKDAFVTIRKMLGDNQISDFADVFRLLYDEVDDYGKGNVADCILTIAKYQLSDAQVVDKEINVMAMMIELLGIIK